LLGGVTIVTVNYQTKTKHMKRYKILRIISVVLLVVGAALIILQIMEGGKSVVQTIGAGGIWIGLGGVWFGVSLRLENKEKASGAPSDTPK
jgi:membrane-bound ClpP family serine protease